MIGAWGGPVRPPNSHTHTIEPVQWGLGGAPSWGVGLGCPGTLLGGWLGVKSAGLALGGQAGGDLGGEGRNKKKSNQNQMRSDQIKGLGGGEGKQGRRAGQFPTVGAVWAAPIRFSSAHSAQPCPALPCPALAGPSRSLKLTQNGGAAGPSRGGRMPEGRGGARSRGRPRSRARALSAERAERPAEVWRKEPKGAERPAEAWRKEPNGAEWAGPRPSGNPRRRRRGGARGDRERDKREEGKKKKKERKNQGSRGAG